MIRKKRPATKYKERNYEGVTMPVETYGICRVTHCYRRRAGIKEILGDMLCQKCFDRGLRGPR